MLGFQSCNRGFFLHLLLELSLFICKICFAQLAYSVILTHVWRRELPSHWKTFTISFYPVRYLDIINMSCTQIIMKIHAKRWYPPLDHSHNLKANMWTSRFCNQIPQTDAAIHIMISRVTAFYRWFSGSFCPCRNRCAMRGKMGLKVWSDPNSKTCSFPHDSCSYFQVFFGPKWK